MISLKRYLVLSAFFLLTGTTSLAQLLGCGPYFSEIGTILASEAMQLDHVRGGNQAYKLYKNDPLFGAWLETQLQPSPRRAEMPIDGWDKRLFAVLEPQGSDWAEATENQVLIDTLAQKFIANRKTISRQLKVEPRTFNFDKELEDDVLEDMFVVLDPRGYAWGLSDVEMVILHMRAGDRLIIDGETYVLGDFLGAGNTTHIWGLESHPGKALRFAFGSERFSYESSVDFLNEMSESTPDPDTGIRTIEIYRAMENAAALLVERIRSDENLWHFSQREEIKELKKKMRYRWIKKLLGLWKQDEIRKLYENLPDDVRLKLDAYMDIASGIPRLGVSDIHLGQLIWDLDTHEWVLVDW